MRRVRADINQNARHIMPDFAILPDRASPIYLAQTLNIQGATRGNEVWDDLGFDPTGAERRKGEPSKSGMICPAFVALLCACRVIYPQSIIDCQILPCKG